MKKRLTTCAIALYYVKNIEYEISLAIEELHYAKVKSDFCRGRKFCLAHRDYCNVHKSTVYGEYINFPLFSLLITNQSPVNKF